MVNILIPMAGAGQRFADAGYTVPKPLIQVDGKPMIEVVIESLGLAGHHVFVVQREHSDRYDVTKLLRALAPGCTIIETPTLTQGTASSTLLAAGLIDSDEPLLIALADQYIEWDPRLMITRTDDADADGAILTFPSSDPKWSYVRTTEDGFITATAEKQVISDLATCGVYYWRRGSDYVRCARGMVRADKRVLGEFYVAPVFNEGIDDGLRFISHPSEQMFGLGTPEDLRGFLEWRSRQRP